MVMPARELVQIPMQVLVAHVVVRPHHPTLEHRPERFDGVDVHPTTDILFLRVLHRLVVVMLLQRVVTLVLVRVNGLALGHRLLNESGERVVQFPSEGASDNLAVSLLRAHHRRLALRSTVACALRLRLVLFLPADVGFVYLDLS